MEWTVRVSNPGRARYSAPVQTGPGAHPAFYTIDTGSYPWVKRPRRGVDHPTPSSSEVKERVGLYLFSHSGPSWPVQGWTLLLPLLFCICRKYRVCTIHFNTSMCICRFRCYIRVVFGCFESMPAMECNYIACVWYVKYGAPILSVLKRVLWIVGMKELRAFPLPPTAILHFIPLSQSQQGKVTVFLVHPMKAPRTVKQMP
jgi:hypothetical protein